MDDFDGFYQARKGLLLQLIEQAMGKMPSVSTSSDEPEADDQEDEAVEVQMADA